MRCGQGGGRGGQGGRVWKCVLGGLLGSRHLDRLSGLLFVPCCCLALDPVPSPGWWTGVGRG